MSARPARIGLAGTAIVAAATIALANGLAFAATPAASPTASAGASSADSVSSDAGLFGVQDPTYDGVYRQSLAILGLVAVGQTPDNAAIAWLLAQQCADGAFTAYRADTSAACSKTSEDENATAMAIQALAAVGKPTAPAIAALKGFQLPDGGFYDSAAFGTPKSDANSTGLAESAFVAAGVDPSSVTRDGKSADDYLRSLQLPCSAASGAGAFDFQDEPTLAANDYATVQAALGQLGKSLPVSPGAVGASVPSCAAPTDAASSTDAALSYLAARLTSTKGAIPSAFGNGSDWTSTANAVLDLVAARAGSDAVAAGVSALRTAAAAYVKTDGAYAPAPLATLLLVAHATGADPASFGGIDLVAALTSTEGAFAAATSAPSLPASPAPTASATPSASAAPTGTGTLPFTGSGGVAPLSVLGGILVLGGAAALFVSRSRASARSR